MFSILTHIMKVQSIHMCHRWQCYTCRQALNVWYMTLIANSCFVVWEEIVDARLGLLAYITISHVCNDKFIKRSFRDIYVSIPFCEISSLVGRCRRAVVKQSVDLLSYWHTIVFWTHFCQASTSSLLVECSDPIILVS